MIDVSNSALLSVDVLIDANRVFSSPKIITPGELHAINSLIEAAAFHERIYIYELPTGEQIGFGDLFNWGLIHPTGVARECEELLTRIGLEDLSVEILIDRTWLNTHVSYNIDRLADELQTLIEYEKTFGFARMSRIMDSNNLDTAYLLGRSADFSRSDMDTLDASYRRMRAMGNVATELGLHLYTGLLSRPFTLEYIGEKRKAALKLFESLSTEFDDWDDSDIPEWRRIKMPALTQTVLKNCKDSPGAFCNELMRIRKDLTGFRQTITDQAIELRNAKTRGAKRKIRMETDKALSAAMEKMESTDRLSHTLWDTLKNPVAAHIKVGDRLVQKDKLNQAVGKAHGLTDLYAMFRDAPTVEQNAMLIKKVFNIECDYQQWNSVHKLASDLETLMRRDVEPDLPTLSQRSS
uniref:hypothetical protein n=1 Tax=Variovorax sp. KBW07 TaxID=2153358 RepID=UPI000F5838EA|nr:hypothetical protein [Variovorax sp. KBW07]RQO55680.1 hypothetical protein DBV14_11705 [Variovorax sp. KBW07]